MSEPKRFNSILREVYPEQVGPIIDPEVYRRVLRMFKKEEP